MKKLQEGRIICTLEKGPANLQSPLKPKPVKLKGGREMVEGRDNMEDRRGRVKMLTYLLKDTPS